MSVPVPPLGRQAKRVYSGMLPEFFDSVIRVDPDPVTEQWIYSAIDPQTGSNVVSAIIEIIYDNTAKDRVLSAKRIDNTI